MSVGLLLLYSLSARPSPPRRGLASLRLAAAGFFLLSMMFFATVEAAVARGRPTWVADELLVGVQAGVSRARAESLYRLHGADLIDDIPQIKVHRIRVPPSAQEAVEQALSRWAEVKFVEKNHLLPPDFVPNDPFYRNEWHLPKISAPQAWEISQGTPGVILAILDSGVEATHPDLAAKLVPGYNFFDNNTDTSDVYGHGTEVAGAAVALSSNGTGVASVAWQNLLMPIRVTDTQGYGSVFAIAQGLAWAVDHGAKVMNLSFAGIARISTIKNAAQYVVSKGGVVVAAAGNCGCLDSTAENPYILSVSATDSTDNLATFSSRGSYVDLSAPGVNIFTTTKGGGYSGVSGTSFASPVTAGVVALMMSANPSLTPAEVETLLEANADDLGIAGYDIAFGFGRVNAYKALLAATNTQPAQRDTTPPTVSISSPANGATVTGTINVAVLATDVAGVTLVKLYLDAVLLASDTTEPFSFSWDTTQSSSGGHTLQAAAYDAAGNSRTSVGVNVSVNNATPDTTPPTVAITSLASRGTVSRTIKIQVKASDNVQVRQVEAYVDGRKISSASCTAASCSRRFRWDTASATKGKHTLSANAYDAAGNLTASSPVTVYK